MLHHPGSRVGSTHRSNLGYCEIASKVALRFVEGRKNKIRTLL